MALNGIETSCDETAASVVRLTPEGEAAVLSSVVHSQIDDHGLVGSTVLKDRVTELLDVKQAVMAADPSFFDGDVAGTAHLSQLQILTEV